MTASHPPLNFLSIASELVRRLIRVDTEMACIELVVTEIAMKFNNIKESEPNPNVY